MSGIRTTALVVVLLVRCSCAFALDPTLDISQYAHTVWRIRDGFLRGTLQAIAQTKDGYLWLGTDSGVFRFDGVRATPWQPPAGQDLPSKNIRTLLGGRDGSLWIATVRGLARWDGRRLTTVAELNGQPVGRVVEGRDGTLWAAAFFASTRWVLCEIRSDHAQCFGHDGGPGAGAIGFLEDAAGNLWVGTLDGIWRWTPGPRTFFPLPNEPNGIQGLADAAGGALLVAAQGGVQRFANGRMELVARFPASIQPPYANQILRDRDGAFWMCTSDGLMHLHHGATDLFTAREGLSGERPSKVLEDAEGNVWVATPEGLDRFRTKSIATWSTKQRLSSATVLSLEASPDGALWVGTVKGLNRLREDDRAVILPDQSLQSIFRDHSGRLWVSSQRGVGFIDRDRFVAVGGLPGGFTRAIAEDSQAVWVANQDLGLFRVSLDAKHVEPTSWAALGHDDPATAMMADPRRNGVWLGFSRGGVAEVVDGRIRTTYSSSDGLPAEWVRDLRLQADGTLWVSTDGGLARVKGSRVAVLTSGDGLPCDDVRWMRVDQDGSFWLATGCGLVRVHRADMDRWVTAVDGGNRPATPVPSTLFDTAEGFPSHGRTSFTSPAVVTRDGRLWFQSLEGVAMVDPRHLPFNRQPPPVHIEHITANRRSYIPDGAGRLTLPALTRDLQIDYTGLSFVAPEKVRFRYLLEGFDRDWQDAGERRQAFYTNLPPRSYRFRVVAANNSGVWNEAGASIDFSVAPAYYQTRWFQVFAVGLVVMLVWAAHRVRVRIIEKHEDEISALNERLMRAQEQERIRIAGELHDDVMQRVAAVTVMLGTAKRRISGDSNAREAIEKVQERLIQIGADVRHLSHGLHPAVLQEAGLPKAVEAYCEEFSATSRIPVTCDTDERARDLSRGAALALFRIMQEALGNAAKHGAATHVTVRLTRSDGTVSLTVSDNGNGFDRARLGSGRGLGLIMMRERATQLKGEFYFDSAPGRGTSIRVVIPFR